MQLREQLLAAELGERFADGESAVDAALIDWKIEPTSNHRWALEHVMMRRPRQGPDARWRQVMRRSTQEGLYHWLNKATRLAASDLSRPGRKCPTERIQPGSDRELELLALMERAGLSDRQREITLAVAHGEPIVAVAERIGIKATTARGHFHRAKGRMRKLAV
jgi:DNA-directed RNA polymerase specialized sigma24 family protein